MLKKYLGGFFWAPTLHKQYQNMSGFASINVLIRNNKQFDQNLHQITFFNIFFEEID